MSEELKQRLRIAISDQETANELIALIEGQSATIAAQEVRIAALEAV